MERAEQTIMALRKEDFDKDNAYQEDTMKRSRITIDISPELRRRIKMAALKNDVSISEYVAGILEQTVPEETSMTEEHRQPLTRKTLEHVLQVRKEIMEHTKGRIFEDSTEIIRQMREERSQELEQL